MVLTSQPQMLMKRKYSWHQLAQPGMHARLKEPLSKTGYVKQPYCSGSVSMNSNTLTRS